MGRILSISGFDGAGKTTQLNLLRELYSSRGYKTSSIFDLKNEETYFEVDELDVYYEYLTKSDIVFSRFYLRSIKTATLQSQLMFNSTDVFNDAETAYELFQSAMFDAQLWFKKVISKLYDEGKTIVFDRYFHDEIAYRALYSLSLAKLEKDYKNKVIPPVCSIYLKLPIREIIGRNKNRDDNRTALFNSSEKLNELYNNYEKLIQTGNFTVLNGLCDIKTIHKKVLAAIDNMV